MEGIELVSFQIISAVGTARSMYIEAIQLAKNKKFDEAFEQLDAGKKVFVEGHKAHATLVMNEANGEKTDITLLLMHAEDQLMSAESFGIIAREFIELYQTLNS